MAVPLAKRERFLCICISRPSKGTELSFGKCHIHGDGDHQHYTDHHDHELLEHSERRGDPWIIEIYHYPQKILVYVTTIIFTVLTMYPILWLVLQSFKRIRPI